MAIKAALTAALLLALVALASATTFTTTITTTTDDENTQQCSQQVQRRRYRSCERFLQQRGSGYANDEDEDEDESFTLAYSQQGSLQACCRELKQMDTQHCSCEAIRHAARQAQQSRSAGYGSTQSHQIYQKARTLPRKCGLRQQQCRFSLVFV